MAVEVFIIVGAAIIKRTGERPRFSAFPHTGRRIAARAGTGTIVITEAGPTVATALEAPVELVAGAVCALVGAGIHRLPGGALAVTNAFFPWRVCRATIRRARRAGGFHNRALAFPVRSCRLMLGVDTFTLARALFVPVLIFRALAFAVCFLSRGGAGV